MKILPLSLMFLLVVILAPNQGLAVSATTTELSLVPTTSTYKCLDLPVNLQTGAKDSGNLTYVRDLQSFLILTGDFRYALGPTGYYGSLTEGSVKAFQQRNNLTPTDGRVGPETREKIKEISCAPLNVGGQMTSLSVAADIMTTRPTALMLESTNTTDKIFDGTLLIAEFPTGASTSSLPIYNFGQTDTFELKVGQGYRLELKSAKYRPSVLLITPEMSSGTSTEVHAVTVSPEKSLSQLSRPIRIKVSRAGTYERLAQASVVVTDSLGNLVDALVSDDNGLTSTFRLDPSRSYRISVSVPDYEKNEMTFISPSSGSTTYTHSVFLSPASVDFGDKPGL